MKPKMLYHFTNTVSVYNIFQEGKLRLTPSNVLMPDDLKTTKAKIQIGNKIFEVYRQTSEKSDNYHPVVWLTSNLVGKDNVGNAQVADKKFDKMHYRIGVKYCDDFVKWTDWEYYKEMERDNPAWLTGLKRSAKDWRSFYICEREIPVNEIVEIYDAFQHKYLDCSKGVDCIDISDI